MGESLFEVFRKDMFEELRKVARTLDEVLSFEVLDESDGMGRWVVFWGNRVTMVTPAQAQNASAPEHWPMFITRQVQRIRGKSLTNPYGNANIFRTDHVQKFIYETLTDILKSHKSHEGAIEAANDKLRQITGDEKISDTAKYRQLNRFLIAELKNRVRPKVGRPTKES